MDRENREIVVLDQTREGVYHGHTRNWKSLTQQQRNALIKGGLTDKKGRILPPTPRPEPLKTDPLKAAPITPPRPTNEI